MPLSQSVVPLPYKIYYDSHFVENKETNTNHWSRCLTMTVRTTPPLAPSRAIASETAFFTKSCHTASKYTISNKDLNKKYLTQNF